MEPPRPDEARARVYHRRQLALSLVGLVASALYLVLLLETRAASELTERLARAQLPWWLALAAVLLVLGGVYRLATLPLSFASGFWLPRRFGLLHQPFAR